MVSGLLLGTLQASGASDGLPLLLDDFQAGDTLWGQFDGVLEIGNGELRLTPPPNTSSGVTHVQRSFDDVEFFARVHTISTPDLTTSGAGLTFWGQDPQNFYLFVVTPNGYATAYRDRNGQWSEVLPMKNVKAAKTGIGASNLIGVATHGVEAMFYVNGLQIGSIRGDVPSGPRYIGFHAVSSPFGSAVFGFSEVSVLLPNSVTAGSIFDGLLKLGKVGLAPEGFVVTSVKFNLNPPHGTAEIVTSLQSNQDNITGELTYRFYPTEGEAAAYVGNDSSQPYADEVQRPGELYTQGHSQFEGDDRLFQWIWRMSPDQQAEWARSVSRSGSLVVIATLVVPRPHVGVKDDIRPATLEGAVRLNNSGLGMADKIEASLPRP